jgi:predicted phosphodiesterase
MRLFATSDLHTDYKENLLWLKQLSDADYQDDALIVAGDISDRLEIIRETLSLIRTKFRHVLFTPGNHELWVRSPEFDSIEKLRRVLSLCEELDVATMPRRLGNLWVVPLFSWYHTDPSAWGSSAAVREGSVAQRSWADFHLCKWPEGVGELSEYFLRMNDPQLKTYDGIVLTFSHFLPRADLLPPSQYLKFDWLPNVSICPGLDEQIRMLSSKVHVCGHTHMNFDRVIDGIRYIQNPVRYPKERITPRPFITMIWSSDTSDQVDLQHLQGESHYKSA